MKDSKKFPVSENWEERTVEIENAVLVTNPTHIMKKSPDVWYTLYELMRQAKESVIITCCTPFFQAICIRNRRDRKGSSEYKDAD